MYLDVGTKKPLISVVEETLITSHMKAFVSKGIHLASFLYLIFDSGLDSLIDGDRLEDLTLLFKILDRVGIDGLTLLKTHFTE